MPRLLTTVACLVFMVPYAFSPCEAVSFTSGGTGSLGPVGTFSDNWEAALLALLFFAVCLAMPLCSSILRPRNNTIFYYTAIVSFCAGVWLVAASELRTLLASGPVIWEYIAMTAAYFLPAAICPLAALILTGARVHYLRYMKLAHMVYALASLVFVSSRLATVAGSLVYFAVLTAGTACMLLILSLQAIRRGNVAAGLFAAGLFFLLGSLFFSGPGERFAVVLPVRHVLHWGLLGLVLTLVGIIRLEAGHPGHVAERAKPPPAVPEDVRRQKPPQNRQQPAGAADALIQPGQAESQAGFETIVAGLAHEISTPLGAGLMAASQLEQELEELTDLYREGNLKKSDLDRHLHSYGESAGIMQANLRRAAELIKNLRNFSVDQAKNEQKFFFAKEYVAGVILCLTPQIRRHGHNIKVDCDNDLEIRTNPGYLSQIITNLVLNSLVHAFAAGEKGRMHVKLDYENNALLLSYSDDGKGISPEVLPRIFEPYFTTRADEGGTGLGLYIIHDLVAKLDGTVECRSCPGQGTTFLIRFPAERR